jgi:hypothetical protein
MRAVYDKHQYWDEKVEAFEALARLIDSIVHPKPVGVPSAKRRGARTNRAS